MTAETNNTWQQQIFFNWWYIGGARLCDACYTVHWVHVRAKKKTASERKDITQQTIQLTLLDWFYRSIMLANRKHFNISSNKIYWCKCSNNGNQSHIVWQSAVGQAKTKRSNSSNCPCVYHCNTYNRLRDINPANQILNTIQKAPAAVRVRHPDRQQHV